MSGVWLEHQALRRWAGFALIKQAELADLCGVTQAMVSRWSSGRAAIPEAALERMLERINQRLKLSHLKVRCRREDLVDRQRQRGTLVDLKRARYCLDRQAYGLARERTFGIPKSSEKPGRAVSYHAGAGERRP